MGFPHPVTLSHPDPTNKPIMQSISGLTVIAVFASFSASTLSAQVYSAGWGDGDNQTTRVQGSVDSNRMASTRGAVHYSWGGIKASGWGKSTAYSLQGEGYGESGHSNTKQGFGEAIYRFKDVVFSDGGTTVNSATVRLNFTVSGSTTGSSPLPRTGRPLTLKMLVDGGARWNQIIKTLGAPAQVASPAITVKTNTPVSLEIHARFEGYGYYDFSIRKAYFSRNRGRVVWNSTPFTLPTGVTVNSRQARIVNNRRLVSAPAINPALTTSYPKAGTNVAIYFTGGEAGSPGLYVFGLPPTSANLPLARWTVLDLPASPLVLAPFVADALGEHTIQGLIPSGLSGGKLGLQAVQTYQGSSTPEPYSSNSYVLNIN